MKDILFLGGQMCISPAPQSPSSKLETTRSLGGQGLTNLRQEIAFGGLGLT